MRSLSRSRCTTRGNKSWNSMCKFRSCWHYSGNNCFVICFVIYRLCNTSNWAAILVFSLAKAYNSLFQSLRGVQYSGRHTKWYAFGSVTSSPSKLWAEDGLIQSEAKNVHDSPGILKKILTGSLGTEVANDQHLMKVRNCFTRGEVLSKYHYYQDCDYQSYDFIALCTSKFPSRATRMRNP